MELLSPLTVLIEPIVLLVSLVFLYGVLLRSQQGRVVKELSLGVLFGFAALYSMSNPIEVSSGVIFDIRSLIVGLAAGLVGWIAGAATLAVAIAYRVYLGGIGTMPGVVSITLAALIGLGWRLALQPRIKNSLIRHGSLGVLISFSMVGIFLLPPEIASEAFRSLVPMIAIANLLGALLVGLLAEREKHLNEAAIQIAREAAQDPLTDLLNRRSTNAKVTELGAPTGAANGRAILCFDVDHFKAVNDEHGHLAGDDVLRTIAERVKTCLRPGDLFSRLGGDEFVIVLPSISQDDASQVAERCRLAVIEEPIDFQDARIPVSISVGVDWQKDPPEFEQQLFTADQALYIAKKEGRNNVALSFNNHSAEVVTPAQVA